jgi:hypothetical protein
MKILMEDNTRMKEIIESLMDKMRKQESGMKNIKKMLSYLSLNQFSESMSFERQRK